MTASDAPDGDEFDSSPVLPTHHRSTFEAPGSGAAGATSAPSGADDDALAAALAEELGRVTRTGSIPVQPPAEAPGGPSLVPPVRQSLPDEALVQWIGDGATLDAMEQLERELSLRQQDASNFAAWEQSMLALGTPDALAAVEGARTGFSDVLSTATGAIPTMPAMPTEPVSPMVDSVPTPEPSAEPAAAPAAEFAPWLSPVDAPPAPVDAAPLPTEWSTPESTPEPSIEPSLEPTPEPSLEPTAESEQSPAAFDHDDAAELNAEQLADLALAPAPQSMPFADIPPPPGESEPLGWVPGAAIPELVEPVVAHPSAPSAPLSSEFDQFLAEAGLAESGVPSPEALPEGQDASGPGAGQVFPLEVHDEGEVVPATVDLVAPRAFRVELASLEPSPLEQRVGRSARLFWIWFAANSSIVSVGLGAVVFSLGVSLRQAIIATLVGVSISSLPLGIGALAGKRSGQPTMVVSRATFGVVGNVLPSLIAFVTRVFWGAVLLWLLALGVSTVLSSTGAVALDAQPVALLTLGAGVLLAGAVAFFGYGLIARVQAVLTVVSSVLVVGFVMLSWPAVDLRAAMRIADGDWMLVATGAVLVFSVIGLAWAMSSADVARYQYPHSSGAGSMLWSWAGAALPAFLLVGYGSLLAASDPDVLSGLLEQPIETLTMLAPPVFVYPMLAVLGLGLLSGAIMTIYSGGFALQALGLRAPRSVMAVVVAVLSGAAAAGILLSVSGFGELVRDLVTTLAVPVAAWVGVFSAELMMRSRRFHSESLVRRGGAYPDVRWVNLVTLVVASVVGFAFTDAAVSWLSWQGFGWPLLGAESGSALVGTDLGVVGALVLALVVTLLTSLRAIRAQEAFEQSSAANGVQQIEPGLAASDAVASGAELD